MITQKENNNRRDFLKKIGLTTVPFLLPATGISAMPFLEVENEKPGKDTTPVNFIYDGLFFSPREYLEKLNEIHRNTPIEPDFYGNGGATKSLEDNFAQLTGKEKAIYLPTGTMANQLAIKLLNGNNTKVMVPENSHVFRDEADAAQRVHNMRLIPVGKGKPYFKLGDLEDSIHYLHKGEVFKSGLGTVVIENPVRRADGAAVPVETIKKISDYCKKHGYKLHLDGARIHIAAAYTHVSLAEYASYFDTVYISLYKYLNAAGGAVLCGEAKIIDRISHQIKIHGGTVFQNWAYTSVALHYLDGIEERWKNVVSNAGKLISELNKIKGVHINNLKNGTNMYHLKLAQDINLKALATYLYKTHNIILGRAGNNIVKLTVNESLLTRDIQSIIKAWKTGIKKARRS